MEAGQGMTGACTIVGSTPIYVTFEIDSIDPSMAPGTGTQELGGFTKREPQATVRLLEGVNIIGADVVEVSPPADLYHLKALAWATMIFQLLCVMADCRRCLPWAGLASGPNLRKSWT